MDFSLGMGGEPKKPKTPQKPHNKIALNIECGFDMRTGGK